MTGQPTADEVERLLGESIHSGEERMAEDKAVQRAAKAVADAAGKTPK